MVFTVMLPILGYILSSPYRDLKNQALQSSKVTLQSNEPTIRRGSYSNKNGNYTIKEDIYGSVSADIKGFAQESNLLAVVKKSPQINLQGHYFIDVHNSIMHSVKKTLEDDGDISVYEVEVVDFLSVFSYIHSKTSYQGVEDLCDFESRPIHCEQEKNFNWDTTTDSAALKNIENSIEIGAGAYMKVMVDVDFELTGTTNFKLVVEPKFIGKIGAEFKIHESELNLLTNETIFHLNTGRFPLYQIGVFGNKFFLKLNITSDIIISNLKLKFTKDFQYKKGLQLTVSKKFVLTSGKDTFSSNQNFEYSIQDLPDSIPTFQLADFSYLKDQVLSILQSIHLLFLADVNFGAKIYLGVESVLSAFPSTDNLFEVDLILNPKFDVDLSIDLESCLLPYIKCKFTPSLDFKFGYSDLIILGKKLINANQYEFPVYNDFQTQELCLFNPSSTDEASSAHISSPSTSYYNYRLTPRLAMKQDSNEEPSQPLYVTFSQLDSDEKVVSSSLCYISSLQYTQTTIDDVEPSQSNECPDWLISKANSNTKLMVSASYDNTLFNAHWTFTETIATYQKSNFISADYSGILPLIKRRLYVDFDIEQISTIEFDKLFTSSANYIAFENNINVPEYTLLKKSNNQYKIEDIDFKSFVSNSKTQNTVWKNENNDEYVQFIITSIIGKDYCTGQCGTINLDFTYYDPTSSSTQTVSFKVEDQADNKGESIPLGNICPYPDGTYYSDKTKRAYTLKLTITNYGNNYYSSTFTLTPGNTEKTITFKDDENDEMITIKYYLRNVNPLIYCQTTGSGIIVQALPITKDPKNSLEFTLSSSPSYTIFDVNLQTTKSYDPDFTYYMPVTFEDYKPITKHTYYGFGKAIILADSNNLIKCSDGYNHLFLSFRKDDTEAISHFCKVYRFFSMLNSDEMSLERKPNGKIKLYSTYSYAPFIGGTHSASSTWGYYSTAKTDAENLAAAEGFDYQLTFINYVRFTMAYMPVQTDIDIYISFYQTHYILNENEMELSIDLTPIYNINDGRNDKTIKFYLNVTGDGLYTFRGTTYDTVNTNNKFELSVSELSQPLNVIRICNDVRTSYCLMTLQSDDTIVLKYDEHSTDGIYIYGDSSTSKLGPGVYYDVFTGGTIQFWKTWEGSLESMKKLVIRSTDKGEVKASVEVKRSNIILSFKYVKQSQNAKLLEEYTLPISRDAIINSGVTEELLSLKSNTVISQDENGNLVFPKTALQSGEDIEITKDSLDKLIGLSSSHVQNENLDLKYSELDLSSTDDDDTTTTGANGGENTPTNTESGDNENNNNNDNTTKPSKIKVYLVVAVIAIVVIVIIIVVIVVLNKKKARAIEPSQEDPNQPTQPNQP